MSKALYVILLENDKYFIYCTDSTEDTKIIIECIFMFPFTKTYKPKQIIETLYHIDEFDVDKMVKKYMAQYGINNVRGGSYQNEKLTYLQDTILKQELEYVNAPGHKNLNPSLKLEEKMRYFVYNELFHIIKHDDECNEIPELQQKIKVQRERYEDIHKKLLKILWAREQNHENPEKHTSYMLDNTLIEKIQYLQKYIVEKKFMNETQNGLNLEIIQLFKELMNYFKHFNRIFQENDFDLSDFTQEYINPVFISHPEFIFSPYVHLSKYNRQSMSFLDQDYKIDEANALCKFFEGICYWCLNRIDEYEFDLKVIPENIKLKYEMVDFLSEFHEKYLI
jgi:hypothetical protein